ncbi:hypothetical protein [Marinobacter sp.]|uniref:hypothetical protein n=1 Tax=Marinobacter sp. TaxID=50741 RepID=UPI002356DB4C|nr:hypothetical protein [Marinobacter sp.]
MGKIKSIDIIKVWLIALIIASFTMFQKIANILSIASFVLITSTLGASYFGYKYLISPQFQNKMMNKVLKNVQGLMPSILDNNIPDTTGKSIPIPFN